MTSILLIYPYFKPRFDRSVFRFPPLGIAYLAAHLLEAGCQVQLLDCTFMDRKKALAAALATKAEVVGIYCMVTMFEDCMWFAENLRLQTRMLVAGGPLPTCDPEPFLEIFDTVVFGEGEQTMTELVQAFVQGSDLEAVAGIAYRADGAAPQTDRPGFITTIPRPFIKDLDRVRFPARSLLPNDRYIRHGRKAYGYSITTLMSTRGCPHRCEFCSNVVFGGSYRARSSQNVVDEVEEILNLGYDRVAFADDLFTLKKGRVVEICDEIARRRLNFAWECLARVDTMDYATAAKMKEAGCARIFFGIESGNDHILKQMQKAIRVEQARAAVEVCHKAGLQVGAFFILYYPGETDETVFNTLRLIDDLPLDYLGLTIPYILPGTALYERVEDSIHRHQGADLFTQVDRVFIYEGEFSKTKMRLAVFKGLAQFKMRKKLGRLAPLFIKPFEKATDELLKWLK